MKRLLELECREIVLVVALSMFMIQLDSAVLTIALPVIARDFGVSVVALSLSITIYLTMLVAVLPVSGWAADRFGARRVFLLATVCFAAFSLCCALSPSFWLFILSRAFQGASASLLVSVGRLLLLKRTSKDELVDALAITAMPMLVAPTVGPSLGGFIVDYARWEYIFLLNLPFALVLFLLTRRTVPHLEPDRSRKLDWSGLILLSSALISLLTGIDRLASGIARPLPWMLIAAGAALGWLTLRHLARHRDPIVALDAMRVPAFRSAAIGAGAYVRLPARAILFALPLMLQIGFGYSPFMAGLMLMVLNGGDLVSKPWIKPAFDRFGFRNTVIAGSAMGLVGMVAMALMGQGQAALWVLIVAMVLAGISRSLVYTAMGTVTFSSLSEDTVTSGNVLASISMQLFNAVAISVTALALGTAAQINGYTEPRLMDFRIAIGVIVAIGLVSTSLVWRHLPRELRELH